MKSNKVIKFKCGKCGKLLAKLFEYATPIFEIKMRCYDCCPNEWPKPDTKLCSMVLKCDIPWKKKK